MEGSIVQIIQAMLAPAVMVSACGLLLLGMNNKYSLIVNRIRSLDDEKRQLQNISANETTNLARLKNINNQLPIFRSRIGLVRNAVFFYSIAVAFFILNSLLIGLEFSLKFEHFNKPAFGFFALGMLSVLLGVMHAAYEVWYGYKVVIIELSQFEN